ncbi:AzlC family ABC transporter permease [Reinekea sp. G2M2-21]|uniref:AzlC family ABC transporter permease n=1 Tax=Reinekea sp. G2M2-21 TaxID=2788942 RepID=UPI0018A96B4F|nr:AzlC family ABC transporter permease [Reinekea sp. G2M2-21]
MTQTKVMFQGALDTLPMVLAAIPFGILFGVLAPANGIASWVAIGFSALVFAGSAQYVAIGLLAAGTPVLLIVVTTFIVNLRHLLYALAMLIPFRHLPRTKKLALSFFLTDETFVIFNQRFQRQLADEHIVPYYLGSAIFMYLNWQVCTWVGLWAGSTLEGIDQLGLEFAMVTAFIAMLLPMCKHRKNIVSAVIGFILAWLTRSWPHKTGIVFSVVAAAFISSQLHFLEDKKDV